MHLSTLRPTAAFAAAIAAAALLAPVGAFASYTPAWYFNGGSEGSFPYAPLTVVGAGNPQTATLWGTNTQHGNYGYGAMYHYSPFLGTLSTVASFSSNITSPSTALVPVTFNSFPPPPPNARPRFAVRGGAQFAHGVTRDNVPQTYTDFFGTSLGPSGFGTIYRYHPGNPVVQMAWPFTGGLDGRYPEGGLVAYGGWLWGVANGGGQNGYGVVFKLNPVTNQLIPVYQFAGGADGAYPNGLIVYGTTLYGATDLGGNQNSGTIFSIDPVSGLHHVVCGSLTFGVTSSLVPYGSGLYYTTWNTNNTHGTISRCSLKTHGQSTVYAFNGGDDGDHPSGSLALHGDVLYGATVSGGAAAHIGSVYSFNLQTSVDTPIHVFASGEGGYPFTGVVYFAGSLWGVTSTGGTANAGTIYSTGLNPYSRIRFHPN